MANLYSEAVMTATELQPFLAALGLEDPVFPLLQDKGFEDLAIIEDMDEQELNSMCAEINILPGHKVKLLRALKRRKEPSGSHYTEEVKQAQKIEFKEGAVFNSKYTCKEVLGEGNFGTAVMALGPTGKKLVLKCQLCDTQTELNQALKEVVALARIPDSPHLLKILDSFQQESSLFIVVDFCQGGTVEAVIGNKLTPDEVLRILSQALKGLVAIHSANMVHRDIKPDNLLFSDAARTIVVIGDMGLARSLEEEIGSYYQSTFGHTLYKAPEVTLRGKFSAAADVWSLGCVIIDLLSGKSMTTRYEESKFVVSGLHADEVQSFIDEVLKQAGAADHPIATAVRAMMTSDYKLRATADQLLESIEGKSDVIFGSRGSQVQPARAPVPDFLMCNKHQKENELFCTNCDVLICMKCFALDHRGHAMEELAETKSKKQQELQQFLDQVSQKPAKWQTLITQAVDMQAELKAGDDENRKSISESFAQLHSALDLREAALLEASNTPQETYSVLEAYVSQSVASMDAFKATCDTLSGLINASGMDILETGNKAKSLVQACEEVGPVPGISGKSFSMEKQQLLDAISGLGKVQDKPLFEDGQLYAVGGHDGSSYLSSVERFDAVTGKWSSVCSMSSRRGFPGVCVL